MLTFRLLERTSEYSIFEYIPEGMLRPGKVIFYSNGNADVLKLSEDDEHLRYVGHALTGILELGKDSGTIAWC